MTATRRARLRDIALSVGVSVNTVSRALAGKDNVSDETRALVQAEAERIGYVPNTHARSLVLGSTMSIGLVITNPSNPFYAQLISGIEVELRAQGYSLVLLVTDESVENEERAVESLLQSAVDGTIGVPVQIESAHWRRLEASGMPLVFANRDVPEFGCDFVGTDHAQGVYEATKHVIDRGAQRIQVLEEDLPITTISERISSFRHAMSDAGLPTSSSDIHLVPTRRYESAALPWQPEEAYRVARDLVTQDDLPDAVVTGNDYFALGLYRALAEQGLRVPDDLAVVGYGDYPFAGYLNPPLTTVRLPARLIGERAVEMLLRHEETKDSPAQKALLAPELIVRESTSQP